MLELLEMMMNYVSGSFCIVTPIWICFLLRKLYYPQIKYICTLFKILKESKIRLSLCWHKRVIFRNVIFALYNIDAKKKGQAISFVQNCFAFAWTRAVWIRQSSRVNRLRVDPIKCICVCIAWKRNKKLSEPAQQQQQKSFHVQKKTTEIHFQFLSCFTIIMVRDKNTDHIWERRHTKPIGSNVVPLLYSFSKAARLWWWPCSDFFWRRKSTAKCR